jgi:uncharacterized membrane protein
MPKFSIEEAVGFGWKTVKEHWTTLIPVTILVGGVGSILSGMLNGDGEGMWMMDSPSDFTSFNLMEYVSFASENILGTVLSTIATGILIFVSLKYVNNKAKDFASLFQGLTPELIVKLIGASILYNLAVMLGLILLIIPGIYLALRFSMASYIIADTNAGIMDAFRESSRLTEGVKWNLILAFIVMGLIMLLGVLALFVGLIVAVPVVLIATTHIYVQLKKSAGKAPVAVEA